ncbi:oxidoreductase [Tetragenococcus osmophilus]|uniref:Oxidoreductase n=1 Tax=Tetragenococcus osmophilus TaxID=526944 RepID=A0AA38CYF1_9ENTE|nr:SDR family oxidoreductase [Tetragenococcus osmophilus]AYW48296.1 oxidoreductase [Tetragenococcus osmophilus]GMA54103.1 oxidoreductase [Alicyclobacillus contaminans]GMA72010.1 oxidoreductase [Tetragenococcus osmophilus]
MENLKNKVVIITGASSGMGKANALYLANQGAKVVLGDIREDRLQTVVQEIEENKGEVVTTVVDVTKREDVQKLVDKAVEYFHRIDVIINCAGVMPQSYLYENNYEEWDKGIDTNLKGMLYGIGAVLPIMHKQESGHIINISSIGAHSVMPGGAVYSATKYAVKALTEGLRQEEAEIGKNVRVMSVSPGSIDTEFTHSIADPEIRAQFDQLSENAISPDAVARLIAFAINEDEEVGLNEVIIRPTNQKL